MDTVVGQVIYLTASQCAISQTGRPFVTSIAPSGTTINLPQNCATWNAHTSVIVGLRATSDIYGLKAINTVIFCDYWDILKPSSWHYMVTPGSTDIGTAGVDSSCSLSYILGNQPGSTDNQVLMTGATGQALSSMKIYSDVGKMMVLYLNWDTIYVPGTSSRPATTTNYLGYIGSNLTLCLSNNVPPPTTPSPVFVNSFSLTYYNATGTSIDPEFSGVLSIPVVTTIDLTNLINYTWNTSPADLENICSQQTSFSSITPTSQLGAACTLMNFTGTNSTGTNSTGTNSTSTSSNTIIYIVIFIAVLIIIVIFLRRLRARRGGR